MRRREYDLDMDYDEGDELPVVDDLEVAAAAAAAAMEGQHSEESSSEESSSSGSESSDTEEGMSEDDDEDMGRQGGVHGRELERVAVDLLVDDAGGSVRVVLQPLTPEPEFAFSTDDEDESDEESEKESDFEEEIEEIASYEELKGIIDAMDDDDEVMHGTADRSAAEELFGAVPPPQLDIQVRPDDVLIPAGSVLSVIEGTIVVRAVAGSRALNEGSALVLQDGTPIGVVEDIFGPVQAPLYALRYAGPAVHAAPQPDSMPPSREPNGEEAVNGVEEDIDLEDAPAERAEVVVEGGKKAGMSGHGMPAALVPEALVFSVERLSNFVLPDDLRVKGYDADEVEKEGMEPAMEFSDDEAEAAYKRKLKSKRKEDREIGDEDLRARQSAPRRGGGSGNPSGGRGRGQSSGRGRGRPQQQQGGWRREQHMHPQHAQHAQMHPHMQMQMHMPPGGYYAPQGYYPAPGYAPQQPQYLGQYYAQQAAAGRGQFQAQATAGQLGAMRLQPHHVFPGAGGYGGGPGMMPPPPGTAPGQGQMQPRPPPPQQ